MPEKLERRAHIATISGSICSAGCLILTGISTYFAWRVYQITARSAGGDQVTTSHAAWLFPLVFGLLTALSVGVNLLAWRMWARIDKGNKEELRKIQVVHEEEIRKLGIAHNSELWRAKEFYRQCEEEKRDAVIRLEETKAPRIYPTLMEPGEVPDHPMQTRLVLENRGDTDAHHVEIKEIELRIGTVTFDGPIGVIAPTRKSEITPRCDASGPAFMMNIISALRKEFGTYPDQLTRETLSIPMIVTYLNFQNEKFETTCDLVFHAIRDALKPNFGNDIPSVEFQNFHFRKMAT